MSDSFERLKAIARDTLEAGGEQKADEVLQEQDLFKSSQIEKDEAKWDQNKVSWWDCFWE
jgi:hypothetical protein